MTDQPETARHLLDRYGLPEDVIDGVLCLHAQELAAVQRRDAAVWGVDTAAGKRILAAADLIDPTRAAAVPVPVPPADRAVLRDRIAEALYERERPPRDPHWPKTFASDRETFEAMADAVLGLLPAPDEAHRLALSEALGLGTGAPWDAIYDRATELGLPPIGEDPVARRLGLVPAPADRAAVLRDFLWRLEQSAGDAAAEKFLDDNPELRRMAAEARGNETPTPAAAPQSPTPTDLRARVLREIIGRITGTSTGDSATEEVGAPWVLAVLEDLLAEQEPAAVVRAAEPADTETPLCDGCGHPKHIALGCSVTQYGEQCVCDEPIAEAQQDGPRTVCVCGHTKGEHLTVSGRLLCDTCDPNSTDNLVCKEFEAL